MHTLWIVVGMSTQPNEVIPQWTMGDRLGKALAHSGLSVAAMSEYLGVSRNTVGNYINDRTRIPRPTLLLWSMRTGVPVEWIEKGEDGQPEPPHGPGLPDDDAPSLDELARKMRSRSRHAAPRHTREYMDVA